MAKPPVEPQGSGSQPDVSGPQTDDDLHAALEDTFPASDPINLTMTGVGAPTTDAPTEPVMPHPLGGSETSSEEALEGTAGEGDLVSDAETIEDGEVLDEDRDLEEQDDDVAQEPLSGFVPRV